MNRSTVGSARLNLQPVNTPVPLFFVVHFAARDSLISNSFLDLFLPLASGRLAVIIIKRSFTTLSYFCLLFLCRSDLPRAGLFRCPDAKCTTEGKVSCCKVKNNLIELTAAVFPPFFFPLPTALPFAKVSLVRMP